MSLDAQKSLVRTLPTQPYSGLLSGFGNKSIFFLELFDSLMFFGLILIANGYTVQTVLEVVLGDSNTDKNSPTYKNAQGVAAGLYSIGTLMLTIGIGSYIYHKYVIYKA